MTDGVHAREKKFVKTTDGVHVVFRADQPPAAVPAGEN